jgi:glycosyltransferase involved in cell wall biosynthesis
MNLKHPNTEYSFEAITVIILTYNNEKSLERALKNTECFTHTLAIDSGSQDKTLAILKNHAHVKVLQNSFTSHAQQRNFALSHCPTRWAFFLDSDEHIPQKLIQFLKDHDHLILNPENDLICITRKEYIHHKEIRHSVGKTGYQIRLMQAPNIQYQGHIHEHPISRRNGKTGFIPPEYFFQHDMTRDFTEIFKRINQYVKLDATKRIEKNKKISFFYILFSLYYNFFRLTLKALPDGWRGLIDAYSFCIYKTSMHLFVYENYQLKKEEKKKIQKSKAND